MTSQASVGRARDTILGAHPNLDTIVAMSGVAAANCHHARDPQRTLKLLQAA